MQRPCSLVQTLGWGIRLDGYRPMKTTRTVFYTKEKKASVDLRVITGKFHWIWTPGWLSFREVDIVIVAFLGLLLECSLLALMISCCTEGCGWWAILFWSTARAEDAVIPSRTTCVAQWFISAVCPFTIQLLGKDPDVKVWGFQRLTRSKSLGLSVVIIMKSSLENPGPSHYAH